MPSQQKGFGKLQSILFPIHAFELKKFLPMSFLMFFILFIYTLARDLKDSFIFIKTHLWAGAPTGARADLISALKFWFVLPGAILLAMLYSWMIGKLGTKKTFYTFFIVFSGFFVLFGLLIFPNVDALIPSTATITTWVDSVPKFLRSVVVCIANWPYALFYVLAELWGTMAISSLFWQFANQITMKHEVKRYFGLFSLVANVGVVASGFLLKGFAPKNTAPVEVWNRNVLVLMILIGLSGAICMWIYRYLTTTIMSDSKFYDPALIKPKKSKEKVGPLEGIRILLKSPYMLLIAVLVLGYGLTMNLFEIVFKGYMAQASNNFTNSMSNLSITTGFITIILVMFSANFLRRTSWKTSALVTPLTFLFALSIFGLALFYGGGKNPMILGMSVLTLIAVIGTAIDAFAKAIKYSLFDPTKSMAYIPLDEDTKTKGQAAVEIIGGRGGKASSAFIQQILLGFSSNILSFVPILCGFFIAGLGAWITAVFKLSPKYEKAVEEQNAAIADSKK